MAFGASDLGTALDTATPLARLREVPSPRGVLSPPGVIAPARAPSESLAIGDRPGAYQWWYFDATSEDGAHTLVVIFFVGSVFSPWYARRLARGERAIAREHVAVNAALYSHGSLAPSRWVFSEYGADALKGRLDPAISIARSSLRRTPRGAYEITLDETAPLLAPPFPMRGTMRFEPTTPSPIEGGEPLVIDDVGAHRWLPVAPSCAVTVDLESPGLRFTGTGYHDLNHGDVPLAKSFSRWTWCRAHDAATGTRIVYDRVLRDGARRVLSLAAPASGRASASVVDQAVANDMPRVRGAWGLLEPARVHFAGESLRGLTRVESSPFYARYVGSAGERARAVAEHLDLDRFDASWVRFLVPFRARRVG